MANKKATALVFEARRDVYGIEQLRKAVTVGDLLAFLEGRDPNEWIVLSHDNGYTYGTVSRRVSVQEYDENDEEYAEFDTGYIYETDYYEEEE